MLKPYDLLKGVLEEIEKGLKDGVNEKSLADTFYLSSVHLRRLFKFTFGRTIGAYIRSRKLAASVEDLLLSDMNVLDIALEYGLDYEQSYIRAFKREFGLTPGDLRKTGQIIKITPPLQLFDSNRLAGGLIFGPDIVIIPQFHVVGKKYKMPFRDDLTLPQQLVTDFFDNERAKIPNAVNPDVLISISKEAGADADYCYFMPSIQVKALDAIPEGFDSYTFPSSLCANFRFVGPGDANLNVYVTDEMFNAIDDFMSDERHNYFLVRKLNIDRFNMAHNKYFSHLEWFAPLMEKSKIGIPKKHTGIIKTFRQETPALRFIGKKYTEPLVDSVYDTILNNLNDWRFNYRFDAIAKTDKDLKTLYEGANAYISLMRKKDGQFLEYWLGIFMPKEAAVPDGYEKIDFPQSALAVCSVYDKRNVVIHYDADCRKKLADDGLKRQEDENWFFQRFNWRTFFEEDEYGKRIVDYCYFL